MATSRSGIFFDSARISLPFVLLLVFGFSWKFFDPTWLDTIEKFIRNIPHTPWAGLIVVLVYCGLSLLVFPISILLYGTILTFGIFPGLIYCFVGTMAAAIFNYYIGVYISQKRVFRLLEYHKLIDLKEALIRPSLAAIMVIRLTPAAPFTLENYLAGAVGVNFRLYAVGTLLGLTPGILCIALITTALSPYVANPIYYIPIYFAISCVLLLIIFAGNKIARAVSRRRLQKKFGSIVYTKIDQIKGAHAYFADMPWLAAYLVSTGQGIESQNYFVKVGSSSGADTLLVFQIVTITPKELLLYVKAKGSLGKSFVRKIVQFFVQNRRIRILVNGVPNLTGDFRFVAKSDAIDETQAFAVALRQLRFVADFDAVVVKDISSRLAKVPHEFKKFQVDPNMVVQNNWPTMAAYVAAMRTKYRQRYQNTLKKSAGMRSERLQLTQIVDHKEEINALFENVVRFDKFNLEQISEDYFVRLAQMSDFSLYGYFLDDRLVAFRSSIDAGVKLIAHYVGFDPVVNAEQKIYNRMLFDYIEEGIIKKMASIHLGRTALEIKSTVGAEREDFTLLFHAENWFYRTVGNYYISRLKATEFEARSPFRDE